MGGCRYGRWGRAGRCLRGWMFVLFVYRGVSKKTQILFWKNFLSLVKDPKSSNAGAGPRQLLSQMLSSQLPCRLPPSGQFLQRTYFFYIFFFIADSFFFLFVFFLAPYSERNFF
jgi:hypothetical protein